MRRLSFLLVLVFVSLSVYSQTPLLERKITVSIVNERLNESLKKISTAGKFTFSYSPAILDDDRIVSHNFVDKSIRQILDEIFQGAVRYKARGKYIILTAAERAAVKKEPAIVTGYVVDESTGERLKDVSVYDPVTLTSAVTDSYGYFEIKIDKPSPELMLSVNRRDYTDTLLVVPSRGRLLNIPIKFDKDKISVIADSVGRKIERFWKRRVHWLNHANIRNIDDTLYRTTQISFVPFLGTNHRMSGHVINDYSFNILGGFSRGVRKAELGGVFNLVRADMEGAQFAGVFNGVGGEVNGLQFAGIFNSNLGVTQGAQFAGVLNINLGGTEGLQFSGVGNLTEGSQKGPQVAGVFNIATQEAGPLQFAGVYNVTANSMKGAQAAGVWNVTAKNIRGAQIAGVFNLAGKEVTGAQIAGVLNFAGKGVNGAQIAGVLNYGGKVKGTQVGLINIADSVTGVPVGFMSLVWKGYHKIEISADEIFYTNLAFRTGVRQFYNIFTAGAKPSTFQQDETFWSFGYGVGTAPRLSSKLFLNVDITANQIVQGNTIEAVNLLNKLYVGFDYQAFKKMSFTFGATLNGYITERTFDQYPPLFTDYQPDIFSDRDFGADHNMKMWLGAKVGVRFL